MKLSVGDLVESPVDFSLVSIEEGRQNTIEERLLWDLGNVGSMPSCDHIQRMQP